MTDFDDILKKGKKSAGVGQTDPETVWKQTVGEVLFALHELNHLYGDPKKHFVQGIERVRCHKCSYITYLLIVYDLETKSSSMKFHAAGWKAIDSVTYECDKCNP